MMTETTETTAKIGPRARTIARILGWELLPNTREYQTDDHAGFVTPEGMQVSANSNGWNNKGKIHVSFDWPRNARGEMYRPYSGDAARPATSINVALSKDDVAIAKEIRRRLIDPALPVWTEHKRRAADSDQYVDRGWVMACAVAKAFDQPVPARAERHDSQRPKSEHAVRIPALGEYASVTVTGSGVTLPTISTATAPQAIELIKAISAILATGPADAE